MPTSERSRSRFHRVTVIATFLALFSQAGSGVGDNTGTLGHHCPRVGETIDVEFTGLATGAEKEAESRTAMVDAAEQYMQRALENIPPQALAHFKKRTILIPVYFNVMHSGSRGKVSRERIIKQVQHLNSTFGGNGAGNARTNFRFTLKSIDYFENLPWFEDLTRGGVREREMKRALRRGGPQELNIYTADLRSMRGWATYPGARGDHLKQDGVVLHHLSLPGGPESSQGDTATHEVGHWLGLHHTFDRGCERHGDYVLDTPSERAPSRGCLADRNTCPAPGKDPVHNFMNYTSDSCRNQFTEGQASRMLGNWVAFRANPTAL
ncbi:zinc metalloprotease [Streptomyces sp. NPDC019539]|uniref:zinc metalloprotease n=1 Tax=Streptomyces sp. NPDC019539 TaxID=3365063 RepID=UPI0037986932